MPLHIYEEPRADGAYVFGLDPAAGQGGGDPAALLVMDARAEPFPRQVLLFRSRNVSYRDLGLLARDLHNGGYPVVRGQTYKGIERSGGLVPEVNGANVAMMDILHDHFEDAYFFQQHSLPSLTHPEGPIRRLGFLTTGGSKTTLLDTLREALESRAFRQSDRYLGLESMYWDRQGGKWDFKAPSVGMEDFGHGDVSVAQALAWVGCLAVQEWIVKRAVAQMGPHQANVPYMNITGRKPVIAGRR